MLQDLRYAVRQLWRDKSFGIIVILTLGMGLTGCILIFSLLNSMMFRPLPYAHGDSQFQIRQFNTERGMDTWSGISGSDLMAIRERQLVFTDIAATRNYNHTVHWEGSSEVVYAHLSTPNYFPLLGVTPALGEIITPENAFIDNQPAAILTWGLWQRLFGGDPNVIGEIVTLESGSCRIVGILPANFRIPRFNDGPLLFKAIAWEEIDRHNHSNRFYHAIGPLRDGVKPGQATADLIRIGATLEDEHPRSNKQVRFQALPLRQGLTFGLEQQLVFLLVTTFLLLGIGCVNVMNLLLARGVKRTREVAVRLAVGARNYHILRQLVTENLLVVTLAAIMGLFLTFWLLPPLLVSLQSIPVFQSFDFITVDRNVVLFTFSVVIVISLLIGALPALQTRNVNVETALREASARSMGSPRGRHIGQFLIGVEVALSVALLMGAGLLVRSFVKVNQADTGIVTEELTVFRTALESGVVTDPVARNAAYEEIRQLLETLPGVRSAALMSGGIPNSSQFGIRFKGAEEALPLEESKRIVIPWIVSTEFSETMGLSLLQGRLIDNRDTANSPLVTVVSRATADAFWPGESPIGKRIQWDYRGTPQTVEVIGVVSDILASGPAPEPLHFALLPHTQQFIRNSNFVLRSQHGGNIAQEAITEAIWQRDPDASLYGFSTIQQNYRDSRSGARLMMLLFVSLGGTALVLCTAGIYSVLSYLVSQRTAEFGLRMALGASPSKILAMVLRQALWVAAWGTAIGCLLGFAGSRFLNMFLFEIERNDPLTYGAIIVGISLLTVLACGVPAWRASKISPMQALRTD